MWRRGALRVLCTLVWLVFPWQSLPAQTLLMEERAGMEVSFGWGGVVISDRWCPVRINVVGGSEAVAGSLFVTTGEGPITHQRIRMPFVATPNATFPFDVAMALPANTSWGDDERWVSVRMADSRGKGIVAGRWYASPRQDQLALPYPAPGSTAMIISVGDSTLKSIQHRWGNAIDDPGTHSVEPEIWAYVDHEQVDVQYLSAATMAYESLAVLVLARRHIDRVPTDVRKAILDWVRRGGTLVLMTDDASPDLRRWLPDEVVTSDILPAEPQIARPELRRFRITEQGEALGWSVSDPLQDMTWDDDELPAPAPGWVATGPCGLGTIRLLAVDPRHLVPEDALRLTWEELLSPLMVTTSLPSRHGWMSESRAKASRRALLDELAGKLDQAQPFPYLIILAFAVLFIVAVTIFDYVLVRRLRLSARSWISALTWISIFSGIAYVTPRLVRTGDAQWRRITIADMAPTLGVGWEDGVSGFFASHPDRVGIDDELGWWQSISAIRWGAPYISPTLNTTQPGSNVPAPIPVNVWTFVTLTDESPPPEVVPDVRLIQGPDGMTVSVAFAEPHRVRSAVIWKDDGFWPCALTSSDNVAWSGPLAERSRISWERVLEQPVAEAATWTIRDASWYGYDASDVGGNVPGLAVGLDGPRRRTEAMRRYVESAEWVVVALYCDDAPCDVAVADAANSSCERVYRILIPYEPEEYEP